MISRAVPVLILILSLPAIVYAGPIQMSSSVTLISPPADVSEGKLESDTVIWAFPEKQNTVLTQALTIDISTPGTSPFNGVQNLSAGSVSAGTRVSSYFVHFDAVGAPTNPVTASGSITFDQSILGLIVLSQSLEDSNAILGFSGTTYDNSVTGQQVEGLEIVGGGVGKDSNDQITLSADRHTVTFGFRDTGAPDDFRVVTAVPEPESVMLAVTGLIGAAALWAGRRRLGPTVVALLLAAAINAPFARAATTYVITDLGFLPGGTYSAATGISSSGEVVGYAGTSSGTQHAFLYSNGAMQDLGTLGGTQSYSAGINANGQIVGYASTAAGSTHAFLYSGGTLQDLGTLPNDSFGTFSSARAINDAGQIVGSSGYSGPGFAFSSAVVYSGGSIKDLGLLPEDNQGGALAINSIGQIVGSSEGSVSSGGGRAFLYSNGTLHDLGTLGGSLSVADGINSHGQIVGYSYIADIGPEHAFLISNGAMIDLGSLGGASSASAAFAINESGQVVGGSDLAGGGGHAFVYNDGTMFDLNSLVPQKSGWVLEQATGINDSGQIVGEGILNGRTTAFLLTPVNVPEPSTGLAAVTALLLAVSTRALKLSKRRRFDAIWKTSARCDGVLRQPIRGGR
ncbi:MAG TPA: hypothetical protein VHD36_09655 [Pirellulales bacterium]|nr:hypothetical protein [Pirellulales bacterium]